MPGDESAVDLDHFLKLRLVVARFGEMDLARWWNTSGLLGGRGEVLLSRGFPKTHYFAQARVVFTVARIRCEELFNPPKSMTLWSVPASLEDRFEAHWQTWLDESADWTPFFEQIADISDEDLLTTLSQFSLLSQPQLEAVGNLRRSAQKRAVLVSGEHQPNNDTITLLAAGFACGEPGNPAIPYARLAADVEPI